MLSTIKSVPSERSERSTKHYLNFIIRRTEKNENKNTTTNEQTQETTKKQNKQNNSSIVASREEYTMKMLKY